MSEVSVCDTKRYDRKYLAQACALARPARTDFP